MLKNCQKNCVTLSFCFILHLLVQRCLGFFFQGCYCTNNFTLFRLKLIRSSTVEGKWNNKNQTNLIFEFLVMLRFKPRCSVSNQLRFCWVTGMFSFLITHLPIKTLPVDLLWQFLQLIMPRLEKSLLCFLIWLLPRCLGCK